MTIRSTALLAASLTMIAPASSQDTTILRRCNRPRPFAPACFATAASIALAAVSKPFGTAPAEFWQCKRISSAEYARESAIAYRRASSDSGDKFVGQRMRSIFMGLLGVCLLLVSLSAGLIRRIVTTLSVPKLEFVGQETCAQLALSNDYAARNSYVFRYSRSS